MNRKQDLTEIYNLAFTPDDKFDKRLFDKGFECCRYILEDGKAVSMAFLFPCSIKTLEGSHEALYLFAAATHPEYKNRGLMTRLLELAKAENKVVILRPANEELVEFYKKRGFAEIRGIENNSTEPYVEASEVLKVVSAGYTRHSDDEFCLMIYSPYKIEIEKLGFIYSME